MFFEVPVPDADWLAEPVRAHQLGPRPAQTDPPAEAVRPDRLLRGGTSPPDAAGGERPEWSLSLLGDWWGLGGAAFGTVGPIADWVNGFALAGRST